MKVNAKAFGERQRGFALIVVMSMVALITLLAVGLVSLAARSTSTASSVRFQTEARANALTAISLALGDLQKAAGPDQRVTATASILFPGGVTGSSAPAHGTKRHWTGVWSTENWNFAAPERGREFEGWLVSLRDPATGARRDQASVGSSSLRLALSTQPGTAEDADDRRNEVTLVGPGSVELDRARPKRVRADKIDLRNDQGVTGRIAWWTGDEGVKAPYSVRDVLASQDGAESWRTPYSAVAAGRAGIEKMSGLASYLDIAHTADPRLPAVNNAQTASLLQDDAMAQTSLRRLYHDLGFQAYGVLADTVKGGLRQDLSLAFEAPLEDFRRVREFHGSAEQNPTNLMGSVFRSANRGGEVWEGTRGNYPTGLGYLFEVPIPPVTVAGRQIPDSLVRGPTWELLRNHYRLYKRETESTDFLGFRVNSDDAWAARGMLPWTYSSARGTETHRYARKRNFLSFHRTSDGPSYLGYEYANFESISNNPNETISTHLQPVEGKLAPQVIRICFLYSVRYNAQGLDVLLDPFVTIWNPYNVPLEFKGIGIAATKWGNALRFTVENQTRGFRREVRFDDNLFNSQSGFVFRVSGDVNPDTSGGNLRLEPGEVRVYAPAASVEQRTFNAVHGVFSYDEGSSMRWPILNASDVATWTASDNITASLRADAGNAENRRADVHLLYSRDHSRNSVDILTYAGPIEDRRNTPEGDHWDIPLIQSITWRGPGMAPTQPRQIVRSGDPQSKQYFAKLDFFKLPPTQSRDGAALAHFNPRAYIYDVRNHDNRRATGSMGVSDKAWTSQIAAISDSTGQIDISTSGRNNGFWGNSIAANGQTRVVAFEVPRQPLISLAQLQHANAGYLSSHPAYAIGASFPNPMIRSLNQMFQRPYPGGGGADSSVDPSQVHVDWSKAANHALWDRYFFSGAHYGNGTPFANLNEVASMLRDPGQPSPLANPRLVRNPFASPEWRARKAEEIQAFDGISRHLLIQGAFNVNSTSVEAWKAVLASLNQREITYLANAVSERSAEFDSPFSRFALPHGDDQDVWRGFRSLSDSEIEQLAVAIVEQVRLRGPFTGLADFVNRRMESHQVRGAAGTIDSAIASTNINRQVRGGSVSTSPGSSTASIPGWLTQGDVLTPLGPTLSARSDTFVIRAYGEVVMPNNEDRTLARAWCEVIVQRLPETIDASEEDFTRMRSGRAARGQGHGYPLTQRDLEYFTRIHNDRDWSNDEWIVDKFESNPEASELAQRFGRRFQIISFRWLDPDEV